VPSVIGNTFLLPYIFETKRGQGFTLFREGITTAGNSPLKISFLLK